MRTNFQDHVVLVTGGSRGIGRAVVEGFAADGAIVYFTYAGNEAAARYVMAELERRGQQARGLKVDVRDAVAVGDAIDAIGEENGGRIDVLVNNAGIIRDGLVAGMDDADWTDVLTTNLSGAFNCIKPTARMMMRRRQGSIINISSIAASRPGRGHANYAASKGGVEALTRALAVELAPKGVRVNCVAPGMIETDMSKTVRDAAGDQILERIALKRYGTPQDVANAVQFLASDLAAYVTGVVLPVDGGV